MATQSRSQQSPGPKWVPFPLKFSGISKVRDRGLPSCTITVRSGLLIIYLFANQEHDNSFTHIFPYIRMNLRGTQSTLFTVLNPLQGQGDLLGPDLQKHQMPL